MAYKPIYEPKHFVNGEEPALNADNLNDIENAIETAEKALANVEVKTFFDLSTDTVRIGSIADANGEWHAIYAPKIIERGTTNSFGVHPKQSTGNHIGTFTINGVDVELYSGPTYYKILEKELKAGEIAYINEYAASVTIDVDNITYCVNDPTCIPRVYEYDSVNRILKIGDFDKDVTIAVFAWR